MKQLKVISFLISFIFSSLCMAAPRPPSQATPDLLKPPLREARVKVLERNRKRSNTSPSQHVALTPIDQGPNFDFPVTYNARVRKWINFFQGPGRRDFQRWIERSHRYAPKITPTLETKGLPTDLIYLAMIESGFSSRAVSTASAVGYWQFIEPTANRYGLQVSWWIDERRDIVKSTLAAANYLNDLHKMFDSWYLAASAYNMGEGRLKRLIKRHNTRNYWILSSKRDFPRETAEYIPKMMAAMLIAKAPQLYGFNDIKPQSQLDYRYLTVRGGTDLENLAHYLSINKKNLRDLNPELVKGFIPHFVSEHRIRVPRTQFSKAYQFSKATL